MQYLAVDLGAESGRVVSGSLAEGGIQIKELHRFPNGAERAGQSLHWDMSRLMRGILEGLRIAAAQGMSEPSVSIDSWGVDYLLFDEAGRIMEPAFHYRDPRCERGAKRLLERIGWPEIFAETGIQFMPMNTLF